MPSIVLRGKRYRLFQWHLYKAQEIIRADIFLVSIELDLSLVDLCPLRDQYFREGVIPHWELAPVLVYMSFIGLAQEI